MIEFLTQRLKWGTRKDRLDREFEEFADAKGEFEAGIILATLKIVHGLIVNLQGFR